MNKETGYEVHTNYKRTTYENETKRTHSKASINLCNSAACVPLIEVLHLEQDYP